MTQSDRPVEVVLLDDDDFMHPVEDVGHFNESAYYNFFDAEQAAGGWVRIGSRGTSIRRSLLQDIIVVILLLGGGLLMTTFLGTRQAVQALSRSIINQSADKVELALERFFDPVERGVLVARSWGGDGLLDIENAPELNRLFQPMLERTPQIASILVADELGAQYQILREENGFRNRLLRPEEWGDRARQVTWSLEDREPRSSWTEREYDPRDRPWFQAALSKQETESETLIHWTHPYVFITDSAPGITAARREPAPAAAAAHCRAAGARPRASVAA